MSFDKYVHHISQKYRLAVAISVIKSKPDNLSIEEYLTQLQNKIRDVETDPNETVCSDDFNFDDDDCNEENDIQMHCNETEVLSENRIGCSVKGNDSQDSQTILNNFVFDEECHPQRENSLGDTIRLLKEVATVQAQPDGDQMYSQLTFCESQENPNNTYYNTNQIQVYEHPINAVNDDIDSQETQLYTLYGYTQDYTHVSQTQNEYFVISDKYIRNNVNGNQNNVNVVNENADIQRSNDNVLIENVMHDTERATNENHTIVNTEMDLRNTKLQYYHSDKEVIHKTGTVSKDVIMNVTKNVVKEIENETISHISNDIDYVLHTHKDIHGFSTAINDNTNMIANITKNHIDTNLNNANANNNSQTTVFNELTNNNDNQQDSQNYSEINKKRTENNNTNDEQEFNENLEAAMDVDDTESDENVQERVPFKVIEELSRIKTYLSRKEKKYDGYSTDSGYRSDSQPRSSLRSLSQQSEGWLNQSAHCLFNYIMQALPTEDIVKEISQVLGKLIDKLHEDENYPPFLEELLQTVDSLLRDIHTDGCTDNMILNKDEKIQRMILLNKSKHILKYSIEKITTRLEQLHRNLTQENLYECTNIIDLENICYIFHILEIFIKRYKKLKDTNETQNSQDVVPKRSSLTELWRKKWNLNNKEIVRNESKICVLKGCSEILNKIIVECMNSYSLVSYAALQCFNLIQD